METAQILATKSKFQSEPGLYYRRILGVEPEAYQDRIIKTVADNRCTAVSSCHDLGKTFTIARLVLWYATCFPYSKVITTAPTYNQVKNILWSEVRAGHSRALVPLGGILNLTEWQLGPDWYALGFTPRNELTGGTGQGTASSFQGFHAPGGILVIFEEATGIPINTWVMAQGLLTQANVKFVAIGNPTSKNSEFYRCFQDAEWAKIYLTCFDSPNLIANGITDLSALQAEIDIVRSLSDVDVQARMKSYKAPRPHLLSLQWVVGRAIVWGLSHPLFVSKALGEFPQEGDNTLMPLGICEEAQRRAPNPLAGERRTLGVDVARFGTDSSVLTYLHGHKFIAKKALVKRDTTEVVGEVIAFSHAHGWPDVIVVDETGLGAGVVDMLNEAKRVRPPTIPSTTEIRGVQFGAGCEVDEDRARYANLKARMFDLLGQDLKGGLALPPEDVYLAELPTILYAYNSKGQMLIESKDDYKKRTGRASPDHADSLALANFGRYDESRVGTFAKTNWQAPPPIAGGLNSGVTW